VVTSVAVPGIGLHAARWLPHSRIAKPAPVSVQYVEPTCRDYSGVILGQSIARPFPKIPPAISIQAAVMQGDQSFASALFRTLFGKGDCHIDHCPLGQTIGWRSQSNHIRTGQSCRGPIPRDTSLGAAGEWAPSQRVGLSPGSKSARR